MFTVYPCSLFDFIELFRSHRRLEGTLPYYILRPVRDLRDVRAVQEVGVVRDVRKKDGLDNLFSFCLAIHAHVSKVRLVSRGCPRINPCRMACVDNATTRTQAIRIYGRAETAKRPAPSRRKRMDGSKNAPQGMLRGADKESI